jgi:putative cell wall-binding protein
MLHVNPRRAAGAFVALLAITGLAAVPSRATEDFSLTRIAGADRYETAANAALEAFGGGAKAAVIARGDAFPDALAGSYLTGVLGAPVLLTKPDALPASTKAALDTLGATTVYLLGGTGAISEAVATEAKGTGSTAREVVRVAGDNRYDTAAKIATGQDSAGIGEVGGKTTALVVSGESFADALAAGPISHAHNLPILLTPSRSLAPEAADALDTLGVDHVVIVGGTAAVSQGVQDAIKAAGPTTERVAGANRYATAAKLADFALAKFADETDRAVDLATGEKFADALAAGPAAGQDKRVLLLTASTTLSSDAQTWLVDNAGTLQDGRVFGGTGAVSDAVVSKAEAAASGAVTGPQSGQLTFEDAANNTYRFVADGADVGTTVLYEPTDTFTVDGVSATVGGFEASATPGDKIRHVPAIGTTHARHELTNVAASSITSGTIGNVDIANHQLDIVNAVNGDAIRKDLAWTGVLWKVDGTQATQPNFEAAINEGDTIDITGTGASATYELTNENVEGVAGSIVAGSNPVLPTTDLKIGQLGDDPANSTNDATYQANGAPNATDTFKVDGQDSDHDTFSTDLTNGDVVTYARAAGVESFALVNRSPSLIKGQATDSLDPTSGPLPTQEPGGSFTVVTEDGPVDVTYAAGGAFVVDGSVANEADFETAYSPGDLVVFRAADAPSGTTQRVELTSKTLAGPVGKTTINTADAANPPGSSDPGPNSYGVVGQDGETVLRQVTYVGATDSSNTYFVNGSAVTLDRFEQELDAVKAGAKTATVQVQITGTGETAVTQHRLTTTAVPGATTTSSTTAAP